VAVLVAYNSLSKEKKFWTKFGLTNYFRSKNAFSLIFVKAVQLTCIVHKINLSANKIFLF
jgi:uncharacterized protein YlbG (UPF0298 family)